MSECRVLAASSVNNVVSRAQQYCPKFARCIEWGMCMQYVTPHRWPGREVHAATVTSLSHGDDAIINGSTVLYCCMLIIVLAACLVQLDCSVQHLLNG
jgi:hypothetical protein